VGDELHQALVGADHTERAIAGVDQRARGLHNVVEHLRQADARGDTDDGVEEAFDTVVAGDRLGHGATLSSRIASQPVRPLPGWARRRAAYTAAWVRRCKPSLVSRFDT
jgi:hypothetical protein